MKANQRLLKLMSIALVVSLTSVSASAEMAASGPVLDLASLNAQDQAPKIAGTIDDPGVKPPQPMKAYSKKETVYVNLTADGKPREQIVTDWIHSDTPGATVRDRTSLKDVQNVKGEEQPRQEGGELVWDLEGTDLYYQGKTDAKLPVDTNITYTLDGKKSRPEALAGKSGHLIIDIQFRNNLKQTVQLKNRTVDMYSPVMAAVAMSLPDDVFRNVTVSNGAVQTDGGTQAVALMAMPGLNESLSLGQYDLPGFDEMDFPDAFTIEADVTEFEMGPIMIMVTTGIPDLEKLDAADDIDKMRADLEDLRGAQDHLTAFDPARRVRSLFTNPDHTEGARTLINDIFDFYDLDTTAMDILPQYVTKENIDLMDRLREDVNDADLDDFLDSGSVDDLKKLMDRMTEQNVERLRALIDDYDTIQEMDGPEMADLIDRSLNLIDALESNSQQLETLTVLINNADGMLDMMDSLGKMGLDDMLSGSNMSALVHAAAEAEVAKKTGGLTVQQMRAAQSLLNVIQPQTFSNDQQNILIGIVKIAQAAGTFPVQVPVAPGASVPVTASDLTTFITTYSATTTISLEEEAPPPANNLLPPEPPEPEPSQPEEDESSNSSSEPEEDSSSSSEPEEETSSSEPEENIPSEPESSPSEEESSSSSEDEASSSEPEITEVILDTYDAATITLPQDVYYKVLQQVVDGVVSNVEAQISAGEAEAMKQFNALPAAVESMKTNVVDQLGGLEQASQKIKEARTFLESMIGPLQQMAEGAEKLCDSMESAPHSGQTEWLLRRTRTMIRHLYDNEDNIRLLQDFVDDYDPADVNKFRRKIDDLKQDLDDVRPILDSLDEDLSDPAVEESFHKAPETTDVLMRMKDDILANREVSEIFRETLLPERVDVANSMFGTLDRLQNEGTVDSRIQQIDDVDELLERKDAIVALADNYRIYTDASEDADTEIKFIMKTDEVQKPEPEEESLPVTEESAGIWNWLKNLFGKMKKDS